MVGTVLCAQGITRYYGDKTQRTTNAMPYPAHIDAGRQVAINTATPCPSSVPRSPRSCGPNAELVAVACDPRRGVLDDAGASQDPRSHVPPRVRHVAVVELRRGNAAHPAQRQWALDVVLAAEYLRRRGALSTAGAYAVNWTVVAVATATSTPRRLAGAAVVAGLTTLKHAWYYRPLMD